MRIQQRLLIVGVALAATVALGGCGGGASARRGADTTCDGKVKGTTHLTVWFHASASVGAEKDTMQRQVAAFNAGQRDVRVKLVTLPEGDYTNLVASAAATGNLPDVLDFDGPNLYNYAWSGKLKPIDSCLTQRQRADLLPSIRQQGTYARRTWGVGTFDSGLGLYVRPSIFRRLGIRMPTDPADAWTAAEFTKILARLRAAGHRRPLDLHLNYTEPDEWNTYGFTPAVWSAGGDLIDRSDYRRVDGVLNGPAAVGALSTIRRWVTAGYVDPSPKADAFQRGRTPISWVGHWLFQEYTDAVGRDLRIVPLPRFGPQPATGMGSWQWGITAGAQDGDAAWRFLSFLLQPKQVLRMTRANGAVPATLSAIRRSPRFAPGGPEHLYIRQLTDGVARPRPQTPAYPALTAAFAKAFEDIVVHRRPVRPTLDAAARSAQDDLAAHQYYKPTGP